MITKEQALSICNKDNVDQLDGMDLIARYVFDRKGIEMLPNPCQTILQAQLYHSMVCCAREWYLSNSF